MTSVALPTPETIKCSYTASGIPKIIHQTWETSVIPEKWIFSTNEWKRLHPDWVYILWTDSWRREYISRYYPEFIEKYDNYKYPIQKADMIRYFILHDFGGLYCDLDMYPKKNIESTLTCNMNYFVLSNNRINNLLINALMISPRGSKIMKDVQNYLKDQKNSFFTNLSKHLTVLYTTGPVMLTEVLYNQTKEPFILLPRKLFNPFSHVQQAYITDDHELTESFIDTLTWDSSWISLDGHIINFVIKNKNIFAVIGILFILGTIFGVGYYMIKYRKCKKNCQSICVSGSLKTNNLVEF